MAALLVVGFGGYLRLLHFLDRRALWLDEAMLALNIAGRSLGELMRPPLDYHQMAPPLFLAIERGAVALAGVNELALRAFPFAAGVSVAGLIFYVARDLLGEGEALLASMLAATSPLLIRYSNEVKPYGSDAAVSLALLLATLVLVTAPSARRWLALLGVGVLALLVSLPAVFVGAAVVCSLFLHRGIRRNHGRWLAWVAGAWGLAVIALYFLFYRPGAENPFQHQGYEGAFLLPDAELPVRLVRGLRGTLLTPLLPSERGPEWQLWLVGIACLVGLASIGRRHGLWALTLLALPVVLAGIASSMKRYPFGVPRMMVYAAPLILVLLVAALSAVSNGLRAWPRSRAFLVIAIAGGVVAPVSAKAWRDAQEPRRFQDTPRLVADFEKRPTPREPVYVGARGLPAWLFYTTDWERLGHRQRRRLRFYAHEATWGRCFENAPSRGHPVVREGFDLVYEFKLRKEILGISTGRQWRYPGWVDAAPDEGWAENEAQRVVDLADRCVWLFFAHLSEMAHKRVMWQLRDNHGGQRLYQRYEKGVVLWRYCMPYRKEAPGD